MAGKRSDLQRAIARLTDQIEPLVAARKVLCDLIEEKPTRKPRTTRAKEPKVTQP